MSAVSADIVMFVVDGSKELSQEDFEIAESIKERNVIALIK